MLLALLVPAALAADVLILWDTVERGVPALQTSLQGAGHTVTLSDTIQYEFDGTNPSLDGFEVVIHLNGDTFDNDMNTAGQQALVDFVAAGGGFLHQEWNAYTYDQALKYQLLGDLTLLQRGGAGAIDTWTVVPGLESHPVVANGNVVVTAVSNLGTARVYDEFPSVVLMKSADGLYDAVVAREWQAGRIVGMAVAGTWSSQDPYDDAFLALMNNSVGWLADCDRDNDGIEGPSCGGDDCDDADDTVQGGVSWFEDLDGDGYGSVAEGTFCDDPGDGWSAVAGDCDDADVTAFPGAPEVPWDGIDQDCDGADLCDVDADGVPAEACGGDDCDDEDTTIGPDVDEVPDDGIDQDCDGDDASTDDDDDGDTGDGSAAGCGCATGGAGGPTAAAALVAFALLRRRARHGESSER